MVTSTLIKGKSSKKSASKFYPMPGKVTTAVSSLTDRPAPESPTPWSGTVLTR
jgi:hypothetical protein